MQVRERNGQGMGMPLAACCSIALRNARKRKRMLAVYSLAKNRDSEADSLVCETHVTTKNENARPVKFD